MGRQYVVPVVRTTAEAFGEQVDREAAHGLARLVDAGEPRAQRLGERCVVVTDHREVAGHVDPGLPAVAEQPPAGRAADQPGPLGWLAVVRL